jgi:hypothetical protein
MVVGAQRAVWYPIFGTLLKGPNRDSNSLRSEACQNSVRRESRRSPVGANSIRPIGRSAGSNQGGARRKPVRGSILATGQFRRLAGTARPLRELRRRSRHSLSSLTTSNKHASAGPLHGYGGPWPVHLRSASRQVCLVVLSCLRDEESHRNKM